MKPHLPAELVLAEHMAPAPRRPATDIIQHSDQGRQREPARDRDPARDEGALGEAPPRRASLLHCRT